MADIIAYGLRMNVRYFNVEKHFSPSNEIFSFSVSLKNVTAERSARHVKPQAESDVKKWVYKVKSLEHCRFSERSVTLCVCIGKPFMESHVTSYNKIYVKYPILFWERYLCFININLAWMSTGGLRMICLHFYKLLLQWTFTILRVYEARLCDLMLQLCGPYACLYSECGQSISWLLTSEDSLWLPTSRVKQSKKRISGKCLFINLKNMTS